MDGSDKGLSSSTPTKTSQLSKDENDQNYQEMGLNLQNSKKPTTKHYMSPTISAVSKATLPRKKILGESNQSFDNHHQNTLNLDSKATQKTQNLETSNESLSQNTPLLSQGTDSHDSEQNNALFADSLSKPYDPVTNYLSPRPKFLRYKPNRRREKFFHKENERKEGNDGLSISADSKKDIDEEVALVSNQGISVCSSLEGPLMQEEDEEFDESDEEFEEIEEERGWCLGVVLKFLLVWVVLVFSTSYISTMNSPTPSFAVQAIEGLKDGYHMIQYQVYGSMDFNHTVVDEGIEGEQEDTDDLSEMMELQSGVSEGVEMVEGDKKGEVVELSEVVDPQSGENTDDLSEMVELQSGEIEGEKKGEVVELSEVAELQSGENEAVEVVEGEKKGGLAELSEVVEPQAAEIDDLCDNGTAKSGEGADQMAENVESHETENVEKFKYLQDFQGLIISNGFDNQDVVSAVSNAMEKENEVVMEPVEELFNEEPGDEDPVDDEMNGTESINLDYSNFEIVNPDAEVNPKDELIEHVETELYLKVVIGVSIFSVIVASLVLGFGVMKKKIVRKDSSMVIKPCTEPVMAEKSNSVLTNEEKKNVKKESSLVIEPYTQSVKAEKSSSLPHYEDKEHMERAVSFAKSMSLIHSIEEDPKESYQSRTPRVEFLGEFEVGEVSSSLKSCGMKSRMVESEVGSHSVSLEKEYGSKAHSMPNRAQSAFSEFSTMVSPSYGSFTAEKKILKKEKQESGDRDCKKVVTTPVRRSSRIRNLQSP